MAYKLMDASSRRWKALYGKKLVRPLLDGVVFKDGIMIADEERNAA